MISVKQNDLDIFFMKQALVLARQAYNNNEVPVGSVVVYNNQIFGRGYNQIEMLQNPMMHAEISAITQASFNLKRWRLTSCTIYSTLEPCFMCAGALINSRIERLVFAALEPKSGCIYSLMNICKDLKLNHNFRVTFGIMASESSNLLKNFFKHLRIYKYKNI